MAVLGAAGTTAPAIVHDLARSDEVARMALLDLDPDKAGAVAEQHGAGKASASGIDARDVDAGRLAVLGIGSSPGKTNLMAAEAARRLGSGAGGIESIDVFAAGRDPAAPADGRPRPPYAIQTLIDELTFEPVVLRDGRPEQIAPLSDGGTVEYGDPIGAAETIYTLHSELATFGESFGCQRASFRLSLAPATVSVHLVKVAGADGTALIARAITRPHFGLGGSVISTATPASACVRLFARGALTATGVHPPERCIDPPLMFAELEARGCTFSFTSSG